MVQKNEHHTFTGMQKDIAISKHPSKYLFDARNIRLTQREDGSTLFAITNEKGTEDTQIRYSGLYYLGHCIIDNYLVVFSTDVEHEEDIAYEGDDYIDRIDLSNLSVKTLGELSLGFSADHLIECLGSYESENIKKVYWTDGFNPPRIINVADPFDYSPDTTSYFDFVPFLKLNETVTVTKNLDSAGMFPAGMIQYAFTYYNKYGQESNIFYSTELHAISHKYRGGNPEEKVSNSFSITINNIDGSTFDHLRAYSILRTSEEGTPQVKRVIDLAIDDSMTSVSFVDTGTIGDAVDPTLLLYIGGEEIIAQTMTSKDNTLFLGDIEIKREDINSTLRESIKTHSGNITFSETNSVAISASDTSDFYSYYNTIDVPPFYKIGEHYRFGVQFQHKSGRWSAPVVLAPDLTVSGSYPTISNNQLTYTIGKTLLNSADIAELQALGYEKARGVVVLPTLQDRLVFTQGILCPTVFNTKMRIANAPFAMSSWFARPDSPYSTIQNNTDGSIADVERYGTYCQYKHLSSLTASDWRGEVQGSKEYSTNPLRNNYYFGVDRSIVTMHSPDVEFDLNMTDTSYTGWKLRLVGRALVTSSASDVDIQTSTPPLYSYLGFNKISYTTKNAGVNSGRSLIAAPLWEDVIYKKESSDVTPGSVDTGYLHYMVYPWQKKGSIGNDVKRSDGSTQTSILQKKKMSTLRFCGENIWHNNIYQYNTISDIGLFDNDQVVLNTIGDSGGANYYGNVDTLFSNQEYNIYTAGGVNGKITDAVQPLSVSGAIQMSSDPVRMKYKSGRHLFFSLGKNGQASYTLPIIGNSTSSTIESYSAPWNAFTEGTTETDTITSSAIATYGMGQYQPGASSYAYLDELTKTGNNSFSPSENDLIIFSDGLGEYFLYELDSDWQTTEPTPATGQVLVKADIVEYEVVNPLTNEERAHTVTYWALAITSNPAGTYYKYVSGNKAYIYEVVNNNNMKFLFATDSGTLTNYSYYLQIYNPGTSDSKKDYSYYWMGELYRDSVTNAFGGNTEDAYKSNIWIPAGDAVPLNTSGTEIKFKYGDTYYQRYDCLKTYAFTNEDENSIIDIASFMCESRVNADGRYDKNRGKTSNLNMSPVNFNLHNPVYSQKNNYFNYRILDEGFYTNNHFPNQITWTKEKQLVADVDLWTNLTLANTYDLDGNKGKIVSLNAWKDQLFCFQDKGISNILFNSRVQIPTSDGVPIEISNNYKVDGYRYLSDGIGCSNKWTIRETPASIYFIDSTSHHLYSIGDGFTNLTVNKNMGSWFNSNGALINKTVYDDVHHDVYLVKDNEALCYSELLGEFTSFMDYGSMHALESYRGNSFSLHNNHLYKMFTGNYNYFFDNYKPWYLTFISNGIDESAMDFDKIFSNIDYRLDFFDEGIYDPDETFDYMRAWNEYQDTQEVTLSTKSDGNGYKTAKFYRGGNPQKKFRIWRIQIPRAKKLKNGQYVSTNDRIRNPWCKITLGKNADESNMKAVLQDLNVQYFL